MLCCGCSELEQANTELIRQADSFNCYRRITVYNASTDTQIWSMEGYIGLDNNSSDELVITAKTGENQYIKNYVYLNRNTMYVVEDLTSTQGKTSLTDKYTISCNWLTGIRIKEREDTD